MLIPGYLVFYTTHDRSGWEYYSNSSTVEGAKESAERLARERGKSLQHVWILQMTTRGTPRIPMPEPLIKWE